jgi:hypothetical protein
MNTEHRRKGKKLNYSEKNLSQCHYVYHKSHMDWCGSGLSYFKPLPFISRLSEIWNGFHRKTSRPAYYIFLVLILQGTIATLPIITSQTDMG